MFLLKLLNNWYNSISDTQTPVKELKMAPPFAFLDVGELEKQFFNSEHDLVDIVSMFKCFIDDIFTIIKGPRKVA